MMIQTAPPGEAHFLCSMREHNGLCGQFVRAFGNDAFERCEPHEEMVYVVGAAGHLLALDVDDGSVFWRKHYPTDYDVGVLTQVCRVET